MKKLRKLLIIGSILLNLMLISGYIKLSSDYNQVNQKNKQCSELVKAWDNLLQEQNNDYVSMSTLAVKHVNSDQLNYDDPKTYDQLKTNADKLAKWHDQLTQSYHQDCE